jgi:hypothetical protein
MGPVGIEPTRVLARRILSPLRLPVPPQPRKVCLLTLDTGSIGPETPTGGGRKENARWNQFLEPRGL